jgi:hypothetical protein
MRSPTSSPPTTYTADKHIEHGVRKASPGTYAMPENKLAWAPGSIDTILAGGEPNELVPTLHPSKSEAGQNFSV